MVLCEKKKDDFFTQDSSIPNFQRSDYFWVCPKFQYSIIPVFCSYGLLCGVILSQFVKLFIISMVQIKISLFKLLNLVIRPNLLKSFNKSILLFFIFKKAIWEIVWYRFCLNNQTYFFTSLDVFSFQFFNNPFKFVDIRAT